MHLFNIGKNKIREDITGKTRHLKTQKNSISKEKKDEKEKTRNNRI
jgi:hypothetical protein